MTEPLTLRTLLNELVAQRLLSGSAVLQITETLMAEQINGLSIKPPTPWFINLVVAISAWLALIPFLAFFSLWIDTVDSIIVAGTFLIITTVWFQTLQQRDALFFNQLALALNLCGQLLLISSIFIKTQNNVATTTLVTIGLEIGLLVVYQDNILRFLAIILATFATLILFYELNSYQAIHGIILVLALGTIGCWLGESYHLTNESLRNWYQPLGYGFVSALLLVLLLSILPKIELIPPFNWWYSTIGLTMLLLMVELSLLKRNNSPINSLRSYAILIGTIVIAFLLYQAPGIIAALLVLLLGFQRHNRLLMSIAFLFLTVFLVAYYYHLDITLLMKSITLISSGLALLLLRFLLKHAFPRLEERQLINTKA
jgi:hypothetical protein